jgi:Protein of unknown function (DUF2934)
MMANWLTAANRKRGTMMKKTTSASSENTETAQNTNSGDTQEKIRLRAYELFELNGRVPGNDMEHWLQAEAELTTEAETEPTKK